MTRRVEQLKVLWWKTERERKKNAWKSHFTWPAALPERLCCRAVMHQFSSTLSDFGERKMSTNCRRRRLFGNTICSVCYILAWHNNHVFCHLPHHSRWGLLENRLSEINNKRRRSTRLISQKLRAICVSVSRAEMKNCFQTRFSTLIIEFQFSSIWDFLRGESGSWHASCADLALVWKSVVEFGRSF